MKRSFYGIDAFYEFSADNFEDFCSNPQRAEEVLQTKLKSLANALRKTDDIVTEMFEDLSRTPNVILKVCIFLHTRKYPLHGYILGVLTYTTAATLN